MITVEIEALIKSHQELLKAVKYCQEQDSNSFRLDQDYLKTVILNAEKVSL